MTLRPLLLLLLAGPTFGSPPCKPVPAADALFDRNHGWLAADAAYTIPLADGVTFWLFGDTLVGDVVNGRRKIDAMPRNTIGLERGGTQRGHLPDPKSMSFQSGKGSAGTFFWRAGAKSWFWPLHGCVTSRGLFVFLTEIEKTEDGSVLGFRQVGTWLARVRNWTKDPAKWRVDYSRVPHCTYPDGGGLTFGTAVLARDRELYIYGVREERKGALLRKSLVLARAPAERPDSFLDWTFRSESDWSADPKLAASLHPEISSEFSVSADPSTGKLLLVYSKDLTPEIRLSSAPEPWGPWDKPRTIYRCPEPAADPKLFAYAAKAHPELSGPGELLLTYVVNTTDLARLAGDTSIYRPRFLTLPLRP